MRTGLQQYRKELQCAAMRRVGQGGPDLEWMTKAALDAELGLADPNAHAEAQTMRRAMQFARDKEEVFEPSGAFKLTVQADPSVSVFEGDVTIPVLEVRAPGSKYMKIEARRNEEDAVIKRIVDTPASFAKADELSSKLKIHTVGSMGEEAAFFTEWSECIDAVKLKTEAKSAREEYCDAGRFDIHRKRTDGDVFGPILHASEYAYAPEPPPVLRHAVAAAIQNRDAKLHSEAQKLEKRVVHEWSSMPSDPVEIRHKELMRAKIPEADPNSIMETLPGCEAHFHTVDAQGAVRDEEGSLVRFAWLGAHGPHGPTPIWTVPAARLYNPLDAIVERALDHATSDGKRGRFKTGVKAWHSFCRDEHASPNRPMDPLSSIWAKLEEEWLAMRFVVALVSERGISPASAAVYWSQVQGWHARDHGIKIAAGMKLERLPQMLKGLRRIYGESTPRERRGIAPQALKRAMDKCLDPANPEHANIRAALATAFSGLLRSAEFALDYGTAWVEAKHLSRADVVSLTETDAVVMMHPCKNMHVLTGKTVPLVLGAGGKYVDAVWELNNLMRVDPVPEHQRKSTPLFRVPSTNAPLRTSAVRDWTKALMHAIGEDPSQFGTHSYRIGGATALFAAGADPTVIRTMGRWSSDCYRLYVRACHERCRAWTKRAGSMTVTDKVVEFDEVDYY